MEKLRINKNDYYLLTKDELESLNGSTIGRSDIAKYWGISLSTLSEQPWRYPNFGRDSNGKSISGVRNYRCLAKEFIKWASTPVEELRKRYKSGNY